MGQNSMQITLSGGSVLGANQQRYAFDFLIVGELDFEKIMKQAAEMQAHMHAMQNQLADTPIQGRAGHELVKVTMSGGGELLDIEIAPELLKPASYPTMRRLILEAVSEANVLKNEMIKRETGYMMKGLGLPTDKT